MFTDMSYTFPYMLDIQDEASYTFMDNFIDDTASLIITLTQGIAAEKGISLDGRILTNDIYENIDPEDRKTTFLTKVDDQELLRIDYTETDTVLIFKDDEDNQCRISLMNPPEK